jgi:hypothetical protein
MAHQNSDWRAIAVVSRPKTASAMQNGGERPDAECHGSKFGREREEAIAALLTQRNFEEAAGAAGIGTQTLIRWLKIPEFQAAQPSSPVRRVLSKAYVQGVLRLLERKVGHRNGREETAARRRLYPLWCVGLRCGVHQSAMRESLEWEALPGLLRECSAA